MPRRERKYKREYMPNFYRGYPVDEEGRILTDKNFSPVGVVEFTDDERVAIENEIATLDLIEIELEEERWRNPSLCIGELLVSADPDSGYRGKWWTMDIRGGKCSVQPVFKLTEAESDKLWGDDLSYGSFNVTFNKERKTFTF